MSKPELLNETPVTMSELKESLKKVVKRDGELNFRASKTEDYLNQFVTLKPKEVKELFVKLKELDVPRLKDAHMIKLIDLLPDTAEEVKFTLAQYTVTVNPENCKKIADIIKGYI